jgi:hypothetical protein
MATEVIKTIKTDGTGDYTSLAAFESGEQRDLVALDEIAVAEVYDNQEVNYLNLSGWVMDSVHRMVVRIPTINGVYDPTYYHHGKEDQGVKLDKTGTSYMFVIRSGHYLSVYGFEITMSAGGKYNPFYKVGTSGSSMYDCVVHNMQYGAVCSEVAQNCIIYDFGMTSSGGAYAGSLSGKTINCTVYADGNSGAYNGQIIIRDSECYNTVIYNATTGGYDNFFSCTGDYNASNDTSAPGTNVIDNITLSGIGWENVTAGSEDFNISSSSVLIGAGIGYNLNSDIPTTDIAGNDRGADTCDIGAFEYVSGTTLSTSSINSSWKIKNIASKNSSYKIYSQNDKSLAWKLLNEKSSNLSWLIFDLSEKNTAWQVLNLKEQETDYKILNQAQKETAWKILSAGVLSQDISWKILKDIEKDISYKVLNETEKDISWQILGINQASISLAWKIINQIEQVVEWKIKDENSSDLAWKILNELSLDTSFKIFEIKSQDLAYKIFNEIEKDISWKIISGVETKTIDLTATKRIFDFNSEQKICAFNSKTRTLIFYQKERK